MPEELWEKMARFLEQEAEAYADLVTLGKKKQEALLKGAISDLEKVVRAEQVLIGRTGRIEEKRWKLQQEVSSIVNKPASEINIGDMISMSQSPHRELLFSSRDSIRNSIEQIRGLNDVNSELINQSLAYVNFMLNALTSRMKGAYDQEGEVIQKASGIVDKKA
jgi:flagellar biosynthesis/type III secretory pathway chaperone